MDGGFAEKYRVTESIPPGDALEAYRAVDAAGAVLTVRIVAPRDPDAFAAELETIAGIEDPHLARLVDWGRRDDGRWFVVEESVAGVDLGTLLAAEGPVAAQAVAAFGVGAATALAALHARGVVHGRVRPDALIHRTDGAVTLVDTAAARALGPADLTAAAPPSSGYYVSPEEVLARPLLPASDVYALGVVLYQLATGRLPCDGPNAFAVAEQHCGGAIAAPSSLNPAVASALENVILRAMSKAPQDRYATAAEMRADLTRVAVGARVGSPPTSVAAAPVKRNPWPWLVGVAALAVIALAVLWVAGVIGGGDGSDKQASPATATVPMLTGMTFDQATSSLQSAGFKLGTVTSQTAAPGATQGTVLQQSPPAGGEAAVGSAIALVVAGAGAGTVGTPDVSGMTEAEAATALTDAGFKLDRVVRVFDAEAPVGEVVDQVPAAGQQAPAGSLVAIAVSQGPQPSASPSAPAVPSVLGMSADEATAAVQTAGFAATVRELPSTSVPAGTVMDQSPAGGVLAEAGTMVTIIVSRGSPTAAP